jgi:4-hydroxybenzoyl-CoA reductase subunit beta
MLRLPQFQFHLPTTLADAAALLGTGLDEASRPVRVVAGGTDLWPNMKRRHQKAATVVSLMRIPELRGIANGDGLRLGATATLTEIAASPLVRARYPDLAKAVASISAPILRNMGTIGGNICLDTRCTYYNQNEEWRRSIDFCMKEEGSVCWVAPGSSRCWAISASDSAPMLVALAARVRLRSQAGDREIPIEALYEDDGIAYLNKRPDEIVTAIVVPTTSDASHCRTAFFKLRRRGSIDFAVLTCAAAIWTDSGGIVTKARLVLGAVASYPTLVAEATTALVGQPLGEETIATAARAARQAATPLDNTDFQAQWRGQMVEVYAGRVLRETGAL